MFDPTAFENMKVVMEGIFYDKDLAGEIMILDRNDMINMAKLSRSYDLSFMASSSRQRHVICKVVLTAGLENLAAELLETARRDELAGCVTFIEFSYQHQFDEKLVADVNNTLKKIWGEKRKISHSVSWESHQMKTDLVNYASSLSFERIIHEDQIDDLASMSEYMIETIEKLEMFL